MDKSPDRKELKAQWKNKTEVETYSLKDIAKHNTKQDCWIVIHGKVYNVTEYLQDHPGGNDVLLEVAGADATTAYEDVGHSEDAGEIMQGFLVGVVEGYDPKSEPTEEVIPNAKVVIHRTTPAESTAASLFTPRVELAALAFGAAGISYILNHYHLLPYGQSSNASSLLSSRPTHSGSFTSGFITATATIGIASILGATYISRVLDTSKSFSSYVPHTQSALPAGHTFRPSGVLKSTTYQKFKLVNKQELSDGIWRFVFALPEKHSILGLPIGQHVAIRASIDEHSVVRSYTPISNNRDLGRLELLIRVYPKGAMGNYLKNLPVGESAEIRGPKGAMKYRRDMAKEIGMVGGGTGITPLFQLVRAICEDPKDNTKISLVYGNRSEGDIMLRKKLDEFARANPQKLQVHYTLDEPSDEWQGGRGHVTKDLLKEKMPAAGPDTKVLLCGPPGMVNAVKNSLGEIGFETPGAVSKMSDQIFCF